MIDADVASAPTPMPIAIRGAGPILEAAVRDTLAQEGMALVEGSPFATTRDFEDFVLSLCGEGSLLPYDAERASPRLQLGELTYSSTEYPAELEIFVHNECSSRRSWPLHIFFHCQISDVTSGGGTTFCDMRAVTAAIPDKIKREFEERGIMYVRNYGGDVGVSLDYGFSGASREAIDDYCEARSIATEWISDTRLRTRTVGPAIVRHPETGEALWFNYAAFYSLESAPPALRKVLSRRPAEHRPFSVVFGDGGEIPTRHMETVVAALRAETHVHLWKPGQTLVLDNMRMAHGRQSFGGRRSIWTIMADEARLPPEARGSGGTNVAPLAQRSLRPKRA